MKRGPAMKRAVGVLLLACACAARPGGSPAPPAPPSSARVAYEAPPAAPHAIEISIDERAAREILASLSRPRFEASDPKVLQDLPAVRLAIEDSTRAPEVFERDFAAAFDEQVRTSVFNFRTIRQEKEHWQPLLDAVASRQAEVARMSSRRAAALLPSDRAVAARLQVYLTFGIAGLADHLVLSGREGREIMIVDLARALGESEAEPLESQLARLSRLIAGEAYRKAWVVYREGNPAWKAVDPSLGTLDILLRSVAEAGPPAVFTVDENFFPLAVWLKEPMRRSIGELNRTADRLAESQESLEKRMELTAEIRRGDFSRRLAGPAGAFLTDAIIQAKGVAALRAALEKGPKAYFEAYDSVAQGNRDLVPLSHVIREKLK